MYYDDVEYALAVIDPDTRDFRFVDKRGHYVHVHEARRFSTVQEAHAYAVRYLYGVAFVISVLDRQEERKL